MYFRNIYHVIINFEARSENCEKWILGSSRVSVCLSVCSSIYPSAWNNSAATERISMKFDILEFLEYV
jgi:hypothetical protein